MPDKEVCMTSSDQYINSSNKFNTCTLLSKQVMTIKRIIN